MAVIHLGPLRCNKRSPLKVDVAVIHQQYVHARQAQTALATLKGLHMLRFVDETRHRVVRLEPVTGLMQRQDPPGPGRGGASVHPGNERSP